MNRTVNLSHLGVFRCLRYVVQSLGLYHLPDRITLCNDEFDIALPGARLPILDSRHQTTMSVDRDKFSRDSENIVKI